MRCLPTFDKLRMFYNHPGFIQPMIEQTRQALEQCSSELRHDVHLVFTAHSIPMGMANNSDYADQLAPYRTTSMIIELLRSDNVIEPRSRCMMM